MMKNPIASRTRLGQSGASLIEVLVSLIILMVGLLGLVGVMIQSQRSQVESYQRVQALLLLQDMGARITANKTAATCYVLATYIGTGNSTIPAGCAVGSASQKARVTQDLTEWRDLLLGSAELTAGADKVGAVIGARGCVQALPGASNVYQISIAWQGGSSIAAPPAGITCGQNLYGADEARRAVSINIELNNLI